jgi:uracil-DNA glycosylase family 4
MEPADEPGDAAPAGLRRGRPLEHLDFVERLAAARIGTTFNQYATSELRRARLSSHLAARAGAETILVGEAPGYRGARVSGVPFTSERQLSGSGPAEATATIVHRVLAELGLEEAVLLWNVVPTHPGTPASNRRPTRAEVAASRPFLAELTRGRRVLAVGRLAAEVLDAPYVRHPAHGGGTAFAEGIRAAFATIPPRRATRAAFS